MERRTGNVVYQRSLNQKYETDVFIAGGGAAGVAAAVAAARGGVRVFLAESMGAFGGLGTTGMVPAFAPFGDGEHILASGIGLEIRKNVSRNIPLSHYWTPINTEELKREYDRIVTEAGVQFSFFTTVYDVIVQEGRIDSVVLGSKSGLFTVKAKVYIDCTGDGDLIAFAGGQFEMGDASGSVMPQTLCSVWANIDRERVLPGAPNRLIEQAYADGVLSQEDRHLPGFFFHDTGIGGGNIGHTFDIDPTDERSLTAAMIRGRAQMLEYERYYKEYLRDGFENMTLVSTAPVLGVRESRRIVCDYMLSVDDFICRAVFDDEIGRYCYPIDIHVKNTDKDEYERFTKEYEKTFKYRLGESYGIPYRSLIPVSFENVLTAGRCMGTDQKMQASIRVMPGCFITGQAAGAAAALASMLPDGETGNVRSVAYRELADALTALGAYLPNRKADV